MRNRVGLFLGKNSARQKSPDKWSRQMLCRPSGTQPNLAHHGAGLLGWRLLLSLGDLLLLSLGLYLLTLLHRLWPICTALTHWGVEALHRFHMDHLPIESMTRFDLAFHGKDA